MNATGLWAVGTIQGLDIVSQIVCWDILTLMLHDLALENKQAEGNMIYCKRYTLVMGIGSGYELDMARCLIIKYMQRAIDIDGLPRGSLGKLKLLENFSSLVTLVILCFLKRGLEPLAQPNPQVTNI